VTRSTTHSGEEAAITECELPVEQRLGLLATATAWMLLGVSLIPANIRPPAVYAALVLGLVLCVSPFIWSGRISQSAAARFYAYSAPGLAAGLVAVALQPFAGDDYPTAAAAALAMGLVWLGAFRLWQEWRRVDDRRWLYFPMAAGFLAGAVRDLSNGIGWSAIAFAVYTGTLFLMLHTLILGRTIRTSCKHTSPE
jgi:hypothetical protein